MVTETDNMNDCEYACIDLLDFDSHTFDTPIKKDLKKYDCDEALLCLPYSPFSLFGTTHRDLNTIHEELSLCSDEEVEYSLLSKNIFNSELRNTSKVGRGSYDNLASLSKNYDHDTSVEACKSNETVNHLASDWGEFVIGDDVINENAMPDKNMVDTDSIEEYEFSLIRPLSQLLLIPEKEDFEKYDDGDEEICCNYINPFSFIGEISRSLMLYTKQLFSACSPIFTCE